MIEIRSYNLIPGTKDEFHQLVITQSIPLLKKWNIDLIAYGPSLHDENSYYLIRSFKSIEDRLEKEIAFYGSDDWLKGPREAIITLIENYTTIVLPAKSFKEWDALIKR